MSSDEKITIRTARESDAPALLAIYAPYVENTAITFEYDVPSIEEFTSRIHHTLEKYPQSSHQVESALHQVRFLPHRTQHPCRQTRC